MFLSTLLLAQAQEILIKPGSIHLTPSELYRRASPAVATVYAGNLQGTAFLIASDLATTCAHVVGDHNVVRLTFPSAREALGAKVISIDPVVDVAVLKLNVKLSRTPLMLDCRVFPLDNATMRSNVGGRVFVVGSPQGLDSSISDGMIAGYRKRSDGNEMLQIICPVSEGSSGSPVFTSDGYVVGMITSTLVDGQNINFAVMSYQAIGSNLLGKVREWDDFTDILQKPTKRRKRRSSGG